MTEKHLIVIRDSIQHAINTIETLARENYPCANFEDEEIGKMYYELIYWVVVVNQKIEAIRQEQKSDIPTDAKV